MRLLVCIKQIMELEANLRIALSNRILVTDDHTQYRISEFDTYAVEMALRMREAVGGQVDVVSVGPVRVAAAVRRAMGMGADRGIHVLTADDCLDPNQIAFVLAKVAERGQYDLILAGVQSEDDRQGVVGPMIAAHLGYPYAIAVHEIRVLEREIEILRELDAGLGECLAVQLPAVVTVHSGADRPRYPSLSNMLRANRAELEVLDSASFNLPAVQQSVEQLSFPLPSRLCLELEGSAQEKAQRLRHILVERHVL